jgi:glutamate---cysteine ligase / carboxylate-amine ligase
VTLAASARQSPGGSARASSKRPEWARWNDALGERYTVGAEEELMLLDAGGVSLAQSGDAVLRGLSVSLAAHTAPETHASVLELVSSVHADAPGAIAELADLRGRMSAELETFGLSAAAAGTYPLLGPSRTRISGSPRYSEVADSMRSLARREPTLALHVHIGIPDPEDALKVLNRMREAVPVLLSLSANSPFCQGEDTGFASTRTVIFQQFPRTGPPRRFNGYRDYVETVDVLVAAGAVPDPSFLWWDARLQPKFGTVELRVMDAQSTIADTAALVALVQSLARLALEDDGPVRATAPEVLSENRFLAARDGIQARLIDAGTRQLVPARELVHELAERCRPHAAALGCAGELDRLGRLVAANGADRQRAEARRAGLAGLVTTLSNRFTTQRSD